MRITAYFKSARKHTNMTAYGHTNVEAHGHTNDSDVTEQKTQNWKPIARPLTDFQKLKNSANQNARRPSCNQNARFKLRPTASNPRPLLAILEVLTPAVAVGSDSS